MIEILFSGEQPNLVFVEVEDGEGHGINVGEWSWRGPFHVLTLGGIDAHTEEQFQTLYKVCREWEAHANNLGDALAKCEEEIARLRAEPPTLESES